MIAPGVNITGRGPQDLAIADFNRDGTLDLATPNLFSSSVSLFSGIRGVRFDAKTPVDPGQNPIALAAADFSGDGNLDLAVALNESNGRVALLRGNGDFTFQPPTSTVVGPDPSDIDAADFNGDGRMDVAVANKGPFSGTGNVSVLLGAGGGAFAPPATLNAGSHPSFVLATDLNADARPDLLVVDNGSFQSQSDPGGIFVFFGNGDGTFQPPVRLDAGLNPTTIAVGDVNADGQPDIALTTTGPSFGFFFGVLLGNGGGSFRPATLSPTGFGPSHVAIADVTQDGKQDRVVAYCCGETDAALIPGNGDGTFQAEDDFPAGANPFRVGGKFQRRRAAGSRRRQYAELLGRGRNRAPPESRGRRRRCPRQ